MLQHIWIAKSSHSVPCIWWTEGRYSFLAKNTWKLERNERRKTTTLFAPKSQISLQWIYKFTLLVLLSNLFPILSLNIVVIVQYLKNMLSRAIANSRRFMFYPKQTTASRWNLQNIPQEQLFQPVGDLIYKVEIPKSKVKVILETLISSLEQVPQFWFQRWWSTSFRNISNENAKEIENCTFFSTSSVTILTVSFCHDTRLNTICCWCFVASSQPTTRAIGQNKSFLRCRF